MPNRESIQPFADPQFLQAVGRMTISFALLDGSLTACIHIAKVQDLRRLAEANYSVKAKEYIEVFEQELKQRGSTKFDRAWFRKLKADLMAVAKTRNSF